MALPNHMTLKLYVIKECWTNKIDCLEFSQLILYICSQYSAEVATVIQFGKSTKRVLDSNMIGQYGNGLKS